MAEGTVTRPRWRTTPRWKRGARVDLSAYLSPRRTTGRSSRALRMGVARHLGNAAPFVQPRLKILRIAVQMPLRQRGRPPALGKRR